MSRRKPIVATKPPSRTVPDDLIESALEDLWPGSWPEPSPMFKRFIVTFAREVAKEAENRILTHIDVPRWSEFDVGTLN